MALGRQGLNFISLIILAHMLTPEDYGLMGMMAIFIAVAETIMDAGMGGALIKKQGASSIDFNTLACYNLAISLFLYFVIFAIAPLVSSYYSEPRLTVLLRLYGLVFIIEAVGLVPRVRMLKELRIKALAIINLACGALSLVFAVIFALLGFGVYTLIFQLIISSSLFAISVVLVTRYRFRFQFSLASFKELFGFGFDTTLANVIRNVSENIIVNVVAKISPLTITGYFNQSYKLQNVVTSTQNSIIDNALFPILTKEDDREIVQHSIKINNIAILIMSVSIALLVLNAHLEVRVLLGEKWLGMVNYLKILFLAGWLQSFTAFNRNIFKSLAQTKEMIFIELISLITLLSLFITSRIGVYGTISSFLFYVFIRWQTSLVFLSRKGHIRYADYMKSFIIKTWGAALSFIMVSFLHLIDNEILNGLLQSIMFLLLVVLWCELQKQEDYLELKRILLSRLRIK